MNRREFFKLFGIAGLFFLCFLDCDRGPNEPERKEKDEPPQTDNMHIK